MVRPGSAGIVSEPRRRVASVADPRVAPRRWRLWRRSSQSRLAADPSWRLKTLLPALLLVVAAASIATKRGPLSFAAAAAAAPTTAASRATSGGRLSASLNSSPSPASASASIATGATATTPSLVPSSLPPAASATRTQPRLPCLHTRAPAELGWPVMRCPAQGVRQVYDEYDQYRALHRTLVHAPLRGVNSSHVEWWFGSALPSTVVYRGRQWDAYQLWHPVDHELFERTTMPDPRDIGAAEQPATPANTTTAAAAAAAAAPPPSPPLLVPAIHITERFRGPLEPTVLAQGAAPAGGNAAAAVVASPAGLAGKGGSGGAGGEGDAANVSAVPYTSFPLDATMVLNDTQRNMHRLLFYIGSTPMQELYHTWQDTPEGLVITTKFILGGRTASASEFNQAVQSVAFPPAQLEAWTLHSVEEFGNLEHFLPQVYERHHGKPVGLMPLPGH